MFNPYIWMLYRESAAGRLNIGRAFSHFARKGGLNDWRLQLNGDVDVFLTEPNQPALPWSEAGSIKLRVLLTEWFDERQDLAQGFRDLLEGDGLLNQWAADDDSGQLFLACFGGEGGEQDVADCIGPISTVMHWLQPDAYVPYFFQEKFKLFVDLCQYFSIPLPTIPGKLQKKERALFYLEVNRALQEFRQQQQLTPAELNAFLYDFAPACLREEADAELPAPQRVWFLMAGIGTESDFALLDNADAQTESVWRGHRDARRGDIAILWCASPRAYLHSVWRIIEDGHDDPFAHWYSQVRIGRPQVVPHLKVKEMKANPILAESPMVRAHFQGCAGKYFRPVDYAALLKEFKRRGMNIDVLPRIPPTPLQLSGDGKALTTKRAVEEALIEPLLKRLGFKPGQDWQRQVVVRMGRGEKVYPDYVIGLNARTDQESASIIIESKFLIATRKDLHETFRQGRSYALRLQARCLVLAALEGLWVIEGNKGFSLADARYWHWQSLEVEGAWQSLREAFHRESR